MTEAAMKTAVKRYNELMFDICHEHLTIGTRFSEDTEDWNLRDLVSEMQYTLDIWNDPDCIAWQDAHDETQPRDKPWYHNWYNEKKRMERFINRYKDEALGLECHAGHCSCWD